MAQKSKYYWLKLKSDFFQQTHIKFLRKLPDGDRLVIVYLKMKLASLESDGLLKYKGFMGDYVEELALNLDEDIYIVKMCLATLQKMNLIELLEGNNVYIPAAIENVGKESESAERVRKHRLLHKESLQCNGETLHVTKCNTEIEIEIEKEIEKEIESKRKGFTPPSISELKEFIKENNYNVDPETFINHYETVGWMVGKNKMKDWKASVRGWHSRNKDTPKTYKSSRPRKNEALENIKRWEKELEEEEKYAKNRR